MRSAGQDARVRVDPDQNLRWIEFRRRYRSYVVKYFTIRYRTAKSAISRTSLSLEMAVNVQVRRLFSGSCFPALCPLEQSNTFPSFADYKNRAQARAAQCSGNPKEGRRPLLSSTLHLQLHAGNALSVNTLPRLRHGTQRIRCSSKELDGNSMPSATDPPESKRTAKMTLQEGLKNVNALLPYAVATAAVLAFVYPPSFTWFLPRYYASALGFLMFAVGINLTATSFLKAMERPAVIAVGYGGQYLIKPILGFVVAYVAVSLLHLPPAMGSGLLLVSCVSGAQLSNYATFMVDPGMAPLSIVMTALSTITAVVVTPALSLLLLGKVLPINVAGMMASITQIVVFPIATGLCLNKFLPSVSNMIRPYLPLCALITTCCCVGSPLAVNIRSLRSKMGLILLIPIFIFHSLAFIAGYRMTKVLFQSEPDVDGLSRTISFETGMQSSLLALALANNFFEDPLMCLPPAISTVLMSLMGFGLTVLWQQRKPSTVAA